MGEVHYQCPTSKVEKITELGRKIRKEKPSVILVRLENILMNKIWGDMEGKKTVSIDKEGLVMSD